MMTCISALDQVRALPLSQVTLKWAGQVIALQTRAIKVTAWIVEWVFALLEPVLGVPGREKLASTRMSRLLNWSAQNCNENQPSDWYLIPYCM
jgi:hypothetical protein